MSAASDALIKGYRPRLPPAKTAGAAPAAATPTAMSSQVSAFLPALPEIILALGAMALLMLGAYRGEGLDSARPAGALALLVVAGSSSSLLPAGLARPSAAAFVVDGFAGS